MGIELEVDKIVDSVQQPVTLCYVLVTNTYGLLKGGIARRAPTVVQSLVILCSSENIHTHSGQCWKEDTVVIPKVWRVS